MTSLANTEAPETIAAMGAELHALSSATKPVTTWAAMAAIQGGNSIGLFWPENWQPEN